MLKVFNDCLNVDTRLQSIKILMASICVCCEMGHADDGDHVLCAGSFAVEIWRPISFVLGVLWVARNSLRERVSVVQASFYPISTRVSVGYVT